MRNTLNPCRRWLFSAAVFILPGVAMASGYSGRIAETGNRTHEVLDKESRTVLKDAPVKVILAQGAARPGGAGAEGGSPPANDGGNPVIDLPRLKPGGGMTQIDPPPPRESILDSIDDGMTRRPHTSTGAACPDCGPLAGRRAELEANLVQARAALDRMRKDYSEQTLRGEDRRLPSQDMADLVARENERIQNRIIEQARNVERTERELEGLRSQLEACNKRCNPQQTSQGGTGVLPGTTPTHPSGCSACNHMGRRQGELERERQAKQAEADRLSQEAREISNRAMDGKAKPGDGSQLQQRRRRIEALTNEIDGLNRETERLDGEMRECEKTACPPPAAEPPRTEPPKTDGDKKPGTSTGTSGSHLPIGGGY